MRGRVIRGLKREIVGDTGGETKGPTDNDEKQGVYGLMEGKTEVKVSKIGGATAK